MLKVKKKLIGDEGPKIKEAMKKQNFLRYRSV
jgi:hypothetical protein